jgi:hypothetical protein
MPLVFLGWDLCSLGRALHHITDATEKISYIEVVRKLLP